MAEPVRAVAVSGASGLVGRALTGALRSLGVAVHPIVRRRPRPGEIGWDEDRGIVDAAGLARVDAVVHLAGENLAAGRWTAARKRRIADSRIDGTAAVARAVAGAHRRGAGPRVLVTASAVGHYGDRGAEPVREHDAPGSGFLAELTTRWEQAADPAREAGIRVVPLRFGIILSPEGGALGRMLPIFRLGLGGRLGDGRHWMSWITLRDTVRAIRFALERDDVRGPVNVVAPEPVTNLEFTRALGAVLARPTCLAVPRPVLELVFGEMAREALLASTRVVPEVLHQAGFRFADPELEAALRTMLRGGS